MTFKLTIRNLGLFAFVWLNIGFALGFAFLMGPVRWVANYSRKNEYSESRESFLIKCLILALVAVSLVVSLLVSSNVIRAKSKIIKITLLAVCIGLGSLALRQLLNPQSMVGIKGEKDTKNKQFIFGSYPTNEELVLLKKEGITSVISLLHPAVTPFEPVLLKEEEENCKKAGIELISIPMLPWISDNEEALKKIKELAEHPKGKYYVHCYLGKDRVNIVKRLISTYNESVKEVAGESRGRSLEGISKFERGDITIIGPKVYYTPYPTDEEYAAYVIAGGVQQVVSLMDSTDKEQLARIEAERSLLETYKIPFKNIRISSGDDVKSLSSLKKMIDTLPKPLVIHRFFTSAAEDVKIINALKK